MSRRTKDKDQEEDRAWIEARKSKTLTEHRRELKSQNSQEEKKATKKAKEQVKKEDIPLDKILDLKKKAQEKNRENIYQKITAEYEREK
jgi:hypothetical protein